MKLRVDKLAEPTIMQRTETATSQRIPERRWNNTDVTSECIIIPASSAASGTDPWDEIHAVLIPEHVYPGQDFLVLFLQAWV